ncbi:MAG: endolytic transglycosylase MltG [Alphaproteobacteria bacterium]|nr:endolytic transglycosylase MltG [Alphaproteobacteria bacterium]
MTLPFSEMPLPTPPPERKSSWIQWAVRTAYGLILLGTLTAALGLGAVFAPGPLPQEKTILISMGTRTRDIGKLLKQENAIHHPLLLRLAAAISGPLKAGEYRLPARASAVDIAKIMHKGLCVVRQFTAVEGQTSAEIVRQLKNEPTLTGPLVGIPAEGSLMPDTYNFSYGDTRAGLIARMQKAMSAKLNDLWTNRDAALPLRSPNEAVTLASIVEKETGKASERPRIAGVFYNRLRVSMRLQSDPTVIYALTSGRTPLNRSLTRDDLTVSSPMNTYVSDGIPPQPICNPGRAALEAVMHPEQNAYLYFVADGTGGHIFAADLGTHNRNVANWRKIESASRP